jgi:hypothetical protein
LCTTAEVAACPNEAKDKDLSESDRLKAVANLHKYQEETRACRDPKVKLQELDLSNLGNWNPNGSGHTWSVKSQDRGHITSQIFRANEA